MNARDRILTRLRQHMPRSPGLVAPVLDPAAAPPASTEAEVARLVANLEAAHAEVRRVAGRDAGRAVVEYCVARQLGSLLLPGAGRLPTLPPSDGGLRVERFDQPIEQIKDRLFAGIDAGLTVADCAIVDTGTLVLSSSVAQPRTLSLVPPIHLCLLDRRRLYPTMASALQAEGWGTTLPTNLIFVSGPSKTADIQQTLAYGAHGPKELVVFLHDGDLA